MDEHKGFLMMSTFEYPGRYTRWKVGFVDPPIEVILVLTRNISTGGVVWSFHAMMRS